MYKKMPSHTKKGSGARLKRFEKKFILPGEVLQEAVNLLEKTMTLQEYDGEKISKVLSVYFDSPDFTTYKDHKNGKEERFKVRFRTYSHSITPNSVGFLEVKWKNKNLTNKYRTKLHFHDILDLLEGKQAYELWDTVNDLNGKTHSWTEFQTAAELLERQNFKPATIVAYHRMAFENPNSRHRVTIDSDIHFSKAQNIDNIYNFAKLATGVKDLFILESKYNRPKHPEWLLTELERLNMAPEKLSKYVNSVELLNMSPYEENDYDKTPMSELIPIFNS